MSAKGKRQSVVPNLESLMVKPATVAAEPEKPAPRAEPAARPGASGRPFG